MTHFSPADWVDFARGLLPQTEAAAIESHLGNSCEECLKSMSVWRAILENLSQEQRYAPPDEVVWEVLAAYAVHKPWRWLHEVARSTKLVFDSLRQPTPAFVRSSTSSSRRLVHEAEPFVIDLRLESIRENLFLIGQILNSERPTEGLYGVDILLVDGEDLVAKTKASTSGEFEVQCDRHRVRDLRLFINIRGHRAIGITIPEGRAEG
jgi:hypothetical protein